MKSYETTQEGGKKTEYTWSNLIPPSPAWLEESSILRDLEKNQDTLLNSISFLKEKELADHCPLFFSCSNACVPLSQMIFYT